MRIGILTHHYVKNYGAFLQAYALMNEIKKMNPYVEIEFIDLVVPKHFLLVFYRSFKSALCKHSLRKLQIEVKTYKMHEKYEHTLPISEQKPDKKFWKRYDKVIIGSDEVWNFMDYSKHPYKFGYGITGPEIYAYAASAGQAQINDIIPSYVSQGMKEFKAIAVRDKNTQQLVKNLIHKNPPLVVDPTLLYDFQLDENILKQSKVNKKYLLIYGCVFTDEQMMVLKQYAANNQLKFLSAGENTSWCENSDKVVNPFEWVNLFKNAECIITGTFHGLMFSLMFRKNFICMPVYKNRINKTKTILENIGMDHRFLEPGRNSDEFRLLLNTETNYKLGNKRIEDMIVSSKDYLWRIVNE